MGREMKVLGKDASVHEKTVQTVTKHKPRQRKKNPRPAKVPVTVHLDLRKHTPAVRAVAMTLAEGDIYRIEQVGLNDLVVHNNRNWRYHDDTQSSEDGPTDRPLAPDESPPAKVST